MASSGTQGTPRNADELIFAKWIVDQEKTKAEWGDRSKKMERVLVDEMGMAIEFKGENVVTMTKNGKTGDGYWKIDGCDKNRLNIEVSAKRDSAKKVKVRITFRGENEFLFQSSEADFDDNLIFRKSDS